MSRFTEQTLATATIARLYALIDPRNDELRYVGWTVKTLSRRLRGHLGDARKDKDKKKKRHSTYWIAQVLRAGYTPEIIELETVPFSEWEEAEIFWVAYFKSLGCRLTNMTRGGDGVVGWTDDMKQRVSKAHKGKKRSEEHKQKLSEAKKRFYAEGGEIWNKGIPHSDETKEKLRQATLNQMVTQGHPMKGKTFSEEVKQHMSEARLKFYAEGGESWNKDNGGYTLNMTAEEIEARNAKGRATRRADDNYGHSEETKQLISRKKKNIPNKKKRLYYTYKGETLSMIEWAERTGIKLGKIRGRVERGWPAEMVFADDKAALVYKGQRISEAKKDKPNGLKGVKIGSRTEEAKRNMSLAQKKYYASGGEPWNKGKKRNKRND